MVRRTKLLRLAAAVSAAAILAIGVGSAAQGAPQAPAPDKITIAYQFGIGYAPLVI